MLFTPSPGHKLSNLLGPPPPVKRDVLYERPDGGWDFGASKLSIDLYHYYFYAFVGFYHRDGLILEAVEPAEKPP